MGEEDGIEAGWELVETLVEKKDEGREEVFDFQLIENLEGGERSSKLDNLVSQMSSENLMKNLSNFVHKDVETVLGIIARAAVCTAVESIVESWVSIVEHHSPSTRVLSQDRLEDEAMVSINGPELPHADPVIKALRAYW